MLQNTTTTDGRDLRLDLFRGLANLAIFLDHVPNNVAAWVTARNYGFSDAADLFVFISGYTVALVYVRQMRARGFVVAATGICGRAWQIYVVHVLVFVFYIAVIGYIAQRYAHAHLLDEFNIRRLIAEPIEFLKHGLLLEFKPLNLDILPLYVVLMAGFPLVLWLLVRMPDVVLAASFALYIAVSAFGWNLPAYPSGHWYFNPFAWQFLFIIGAWMAVGGAQRLEGIIKTRAAIATAIVVLVFGCVITLTQRLGLDAWLLNALAQPFTPNDKTNLAPYRIVHFLALALVVVYLVPQSARALGYRWLTPLMLCGRHSLEVFSVGLFLSFIAYFAVEIVSDSAMFQIGVSAIGIGLMFATAYLRTWIKKSTNLMAVRRMSSVRS